MTKNIAMLCNSKSNSQLLYRKIPRQSKTKYNAVQTTLVSGSTAVMIHTLTLVPLRRNESPTITTH